MRHTSLSLKLFHNIILIQSLSFRVLQRNATDGINEHQYIWFIMWRIGCGSCNPTMERAKIWQLFSPCDWMSQHFHPSSGVLEYFWYLVYFGILNKCVLMPSEAGICNRTDEFASTHEGMQMERKSFLLPYPFMLTATRRHISDSGWLFLNHN